MGAGVRVGAEYECECVMCLENTTDTRHLSIRLVCPHIVMASLARQQGTHSSTRLLCFLQPFQFSKQLPSLSGSG